MTLSVELREYLEARVQHEHDLVETRLAALAEALRLQHSEYARRLDELNHAHAQAVQNWQRYLPREVFDTNAGAAESRMRTIERALGDLQGELRASQASMRAWGAAGAVGVTLASLVISVALKVWG